ncbi:MAG: FKBP-type peptidyl-prolyl cis-trans isomerase [Bacteroidota bacterium]
MRTRFSLLALAVVAFGWTGCQLGSPTTTETGLIHEVLERGSGPQPDSGDVVRVHYVGMLEDSTVFDNSYDRNEPLTFPLGQGVVIPGWEEGIQLMQAGERCRLTIPPELAFGEAGAGGGQIPPNATLTFEVELVEIVEFPEAPIAVAEDAYVEMEEGLRFADVEKGTGPTATAGKLVTVQYTGWLEDGTLFDTSLGRGRPITFLLGVGQVIPGWDRGLEGMQIGGTRQLVIAPELAYGPQGTPDGPIPPNATLIFDVELEGVADPPSMAPPADSAATDPAR